MSGLSDASRKFCIDMQSPLYTGRVICWWIMNFSQNQNKVQGLVVTNCDVLIKITIVWWIFSQLTCCDYYRLPTHHKRCTLLSTVASNTVFHFFQSVAHACWFLIPVRFKSSSTSSIHLFLVPFWLLLFGGGAFFHFSFVQYVYTILIQAIL